MGAMSGRLWPDVRALAALFFIWLAINGRSSCQVWAAPSYFLPVFYQAEETVQHVHLDIQCILSSGMGLGLPEHLHGCRHTTNWNKMVF